ncbi:UNVERIFIED_CONTAM: Serine/threonine-protein kinase tel1 [Siphonaria sp. JEL0065]|nr:Serine/threonine-protein kinase tel1 [Siphonaria sp. JEL0065]
MDLLLGTARRLANSDKASERTKALTEFQQLLTDTALQTTPQNPQTTKRILEKLVFANAAETETQKSSAKPSTKRLDDLAKILVKTTKLLRLSLGLSHRLLLDHCIATIALPTRDYALYKPLLSYLKIICLLLDQKHYRDHVSRAQWKALMDLVTNNLFPDSCGISNASDNSENTAYFTTTCTPASLASGVRLDLACILFSLCLIHQKDVCNKSFQLMDNVVALLKMRQNDVSIKQTNRSVPPLVTPTPQVIHALYQTAFKELQSKRANIQCLANPSLFLSALSCSFTSSAPILSLRHATDVTFLHDADSNDRVVSTWIFIDLFSDILYHSIYLSASSSTTSSTTANSQEEFELTSRKRRKTSNTQSNVTSTTTTATLEFLTLLKVAGNQRNIALQILSLLFKKMSLFEYPLGFEPFVFLEHVIGLLSSDADNPWVYICLGFLSEVKAVAMSLDEWDKAFELCVRKFEATHCEPSFHLLSNLYTNLNLAGATISLTKYFAADKFGKDHRISATVCKFMIQSDFLLETKSKKQLKDLANVLLEQTAVFHSATILPCMLVEAILRLLCGTPRQVTGFASSRNDLEGCHEFGFWPANVVPTETMLEEWTFSELKKSVCVAVFESYELILPARAVDSAASATCNRTEFGWLINRLTDILTSVVSNAPTSPSATSSLLYFSSICNEILSFVVQEAPNFSTLVQNTILIELDKAFTSMQHTLNPVHQMDSATSITNLRLLRHSQHDFEVKDNDAQSDECFPGSLSYFSQYDGPVGGAARVDFKRVKAVLVAETCSHVLRVFEVRKSGGSGRSQGFVDLVLRSLGGLVMCLSEDAGRASLNLSAHLHQVTKILDAIEASMNSFLDEKNQWTWLEICRVLRMIMKSVLEISDSDNIRFVVQLLGFFASELQKGQVVWQFSLMQEILILDHEHQFLLTDPDTLYFTTQKGRAMTPLPFLSLLCRHPQFQVRVYSANRIKSLLGQPNCKPHIVADISANAVNMGNLPAESLVLMIFCLENQLEDRELLYFFLTKTTEKGLEFVCRAVCGGEKGMLSKFIGNTAQMLARSLAANSETVAKATALVDSLPLAKCGSKTLDFLTTFSGYFTAKFLSKEDYDSVDEMCHFLDVSRGNLLRQGFDVVVGKLFSMANPGNAGGWCAKEMGGNEAFSHCLKLRTQAIICEIICNFDSASVSPDPFKNDPLMKAMYMKLFGGQANRTIPNNRVSISTALEIMDTMAALFEADCLSSLVTKWDVFSLLALVNEHLEAIVILSERERIARNSIGFLLIMAANSLDTPLLLQMLLAIALKFLSADIAFLSTALSAVLSCTCVSDKYQAISIAKVIYTVAVRAEELSLKHPTENWFLTSLDFLLQSLTRFPHIQTISLVFIDGSNPIFETVFETYGHLFSSMCDFSRLVEEAIEYSIPGAEIAIVKFIHHCLETGKELVVLSKTVLFLNNIVGSKTLGANEMVKTLATQCLAMLLEDIPDSLSLELDTNHQGSVLALLTSCLEDLSPVVLKEASSSIGQILLVDGGVFWSTAVKENTPCWKTFEFFRDNAVVESLESVTKDPNNLNLGLWSTFDVSLICENLVTSFETDGVFTALHNMFKIVPKIAAAVFPLLVHNILLKEKKAKGAAPMTPTKTALSQCFAKFFENVEGQSYSAVLSIVGTLSYLRTQMISRNSSSYDVNFWLDVDYFQAAKAAILVKNRTLGLLFYELWRCGRDAGEAGGDLVMLLDIYQALDQDGVDGVMGCIELSEANILKTYDQHKEYTKSLSSYNAQLMSSSLMGSFSLCAVKNSPNSESGFSLSMSHLGCYYGVLKTIDEDPKLVDLHYESLWRCGKWDSVPSDADKGTGLNYFIFNAGRSLDLFDVQSTSSHLQDGFLYLSTSLDLIDVTNSLNIQSRLLPALRLHELQSITSLHESFEHATAKRIFKSWDTRLEKLLPKIKFDMLESFINNRIVALLSLLKSISTPQSTAFGWVHDYLSKTILLYSKYARKSGNLQFCTISMSIMKGLTAVKGSNVDVVSEFEEFKVLYHQGNESLAIRKLKNTTNMVCSAITPMAAAKLFGKLANWSDMQRSESPQSILAYFDKSSQYAITAAQPSNANLYPTAKLSSCFYHYASFADKTYSLMVANESHETMKSLVEERQLEMDALNAKLKLKTDDVGIKSAARRLNNQIRFDKSEIYRYSKEMEKFLLQSIEN